MHPPRIPDHEVVRVIGEGSHGQVWLARSVLGVWRAAKVVRRDLFDDERPYGREFAGVQRFEPLSREDDGFVDVLHTGRNDAEGYFYYVMELADDAGRPGTVALDPATYEPCTLARVLSGRMRLDVERCVDLGLRLTSALGRLHKAGLIHRDVKPSNIVLVGGKPKLADIGLVVEQSEARSYVGTDGYIPPEGPNSAQADVYSLGMVLYEAGMGLRRHDFPRPADAMDGGSQAGVLRELNAVVLKACAAQPERRYATAEEMAADLALIASGGSVRRRHRLRRLRRGLAMAAMVSGGVLLGAMAWKWRRDAWVEAGRLARLDEQERRVAQMHLASATRSMGEGDDAMALVWLAQAIGSKEARGDGAMAERVLARQLRGRLPVLRAAIPAGGGLFSVAYSPDGAAILTADDRGMATMWDAASGDVLHGPVRCGSRPLQVQWAGDGRKAWAAPRIDLPSFRQPSEATGKVTWLDLATGKEAASAWDGVGWAVASDDKRWMATAESGFRVGLGRADGAGERVRLDGHRGPLDALAFSPDSALLASGSYDGTVRLWRVPDGAPVGGPLRAMGHVAAISWGRGGQTLATLSVDESHVRQTLEWWEIGKGGQRVRALQVNGTGSLLEHAGFHGQRLVFMGENNDLSVRSARDGSVALPDLPMGGSRCRAWAPGSDGMVLLVGRSDGDARLWSLEDGRPMVSSLRHPRTVRWVAFHPSGDSWFTGAEDGAVRIWEGSKPAGWTKGQSGLGRWGCSAERGRRQGFGGAAWNEQGTALLTVACREGADAVVAMTVDRAEWTNVAGGLVFSSDMAVTAAHTGDAWVVSGLMRETAGARSDGQDMLWVSRGADRWHTRRIPHPADVSDLQLIRPDRLVTVDVRGVVRVWNPAEGRLQGAWGTPSSTPLSHRLSWDGARVARLDAEKGRVRTWNWEVPEADAFEFAVDAMASAITFLGPSSLLATLHGAAKPSFWDATTGKALAVDGVSLGGTRTIDWNPQKRWLLACPDTGPATLHDLARGERHTVGDPRMSRRGQQVAFSPDGAWILGVDSDNHVRVYDPATGQAVTPSLEHQGKVWWAGISRDHLLVTLSGHDEVRTWSLKPDSTPAKALLQEAQRLAGRHLDSHGRESWLTPQELSELFRDRVVPANPTASATSAGVPRR